MLTLNFNPLIRIGSGICDHAEPILASSIPFLHLSDMLLASVNIIIKPVYDIMDQDLLGQYVPYQSVPVYQITRLQ